MDIKTQWQQQQQQQQRQQKQPPQQQASSHQQHFLYQQSPQQQLPQQQQSLEQELFQQEHSQAQQVPILQQPTNFLMPQTVNVPSTIQQQQQIAQAQLLFQQQKQQERRIKNREAASRSHLKKQIHCEELRTRVDILNAENMALRTEWTRLSEKCKKLTAENTFLQGQLQTAQDTAEVHGDERVESQLGDLLAVGPFESHERILDMRSQSTQIHDRHDEDL